MKDIQIIVTDNELNRLAEEIATEMGIPLSDKPDQYFGTPVLFDLDAIETIASYPLLDGLANTMDMDFPDSIELPNTISAESVSVVFESTLGLWGNNIAHLDYVADIDGALEKFLSDNQLGTLAA